MDLSISRFWRKKEIIYKLSGANARAVVKFITRQKMRAHIAEVEK